MAKLNVRGLVHRLGGQKALSRHLAVNGHEISLDGIEKWCMRGSIPGLWLARLHDVAAELEIDPKSVSEILQEKIA